MTSHHQIDRYPSRCGSPAQVYARVDPVVHAQDHSERAASHCLSVDQIREFDEKGYLLLENLFTPDEVAALLDEATRLRTDAMLSRREETVIEPSGNEVRSIFDVQRFSEPCRRVVYDARIVDKVRFLLDDEIYLHQSRLNYKPGLRGDAFYWHSDFETWHVEDGMPRMRAMSASLALTDNYTCNGPVMVIPGSHRKFLACAGETPDENYKTSLREQRYGVPDDDALREMVHRHGIVEITGKAGALLLFDCNLMHGSASNITPHPRSNLFFVYNAINNQLLNPFCKRAPRPEYIAHRSQVEVIR